MPYKVEIMRYLWEVGEAKSVQVWKHLWSGIDEDLNKSRASVINFLNSLVDEDIAGFDEKAGKGGYHKVYYLNPDTDTEEKFRRTMALRIQMALKRELLA